MSLLMENRTTFRTRTNTTVMVFGGTLGSRLSIIRTSVRAARKIAYLFADREKFFRADKQ